jgi:hypothetical protein
MGERSNNPVAEIGCRFDRSVNEVSSSAAEGSARARPRLAIEAVSSAPLGERGTAIKP